MTANHARRRAFTLLECTVAILVLGVSVVAITQAMVAGQQQSHEALHHRRGLVLAESMVDEVVRLPFADPEVGAVSIGPEQAEEGDRSLFDDADDFDGHLEVVGSLADASGTPYQTQYQKFNRSVTTRASTQVVAGFSAPIEGLEVIVTVTDEEGQQWKVARFVPRPVE